MPGRQRRLASKSAFTSSVIDQVKLTRSKARPPNVLGLRSATEFNLTPGRPHLIALYAAAVWCNPRALLSHGFPTRLRVRSSKREGGSLPLVWPEVGGGASPKKSSGSGFRRA